MTGWQPPELILMRTGRGADGTVVISGLSPVCYISNYTACLHRQAKIKMPILSANRIGGVFTDT